ncbi:acyl-CoA ligase (AMP-forming), exosortase A system-associated [Nitrosomonas sp. HPC101]|uniref:acyl-CoA ligase (AMP-forming), exosortase A system-associated n=1 Tax=Nitrosomonas sp. HPC101 TaxID=1658667 RepID=UPI00136AFB62|nr:acyl-CoA ligase (AMP-forming), exosortase A system-associated [Nitrosomonas sp. HPC101]MXS84359.1 acyl-CoA ligase (AMP-forming), exosortase A system-associated [Nitrosomonas sp. HPC101]
MTSLFHELVYQSADRAINPVALIDQKRHLSYPALAEAVQSFAGILHTFNLSRGERVAVYLEKRLETVIALFGTSAAGGAFVPANPLLKAEQVAYILNDCNVRILVTSADRLNLLSPVLSQCHDLHTVITVDEFQGSPPASGPNIVSWQQAQTSSSKAVRLPRCIDSDMAAILYTSGSTGKPKGVVLSHRNLVTGAKSVSQYLSNRANDRILAVLPLSFDYGLNQLNTAFYVGATAVLMNYLLPRDILSIIKREQITGLAAVPPLWTQLAQLDWQGIQTLRYITNSGGAMPRSTLSRLRNALPDTEIFLMYGLTEAFRSTYLPPEEVDSRPDSMGKAIPNAEVMVLREDGTHCASGEPGELVHRGPLVSMGYWNDPGKTSARFRPLTPRQSGLTLPELAVWSGDTVRMDEEGYLYFIGRRDDMIKTSGYRVSPTEIEEVIYATETVAEAAAFGAPHPTLGQAIVVVAVPKTGLELNQDILSAACKNHLPAFMQPGLITLRQTSLPRNPNGKIDRKNLASEFQYIFQTEET